MYNNYFTFILSNEINLESFINTVLDTFKNLDKINKLKLVYIFENFGLDPKLIRFRKNKYNKITINNMLIVDFIQTELEKKNIINLLNLSNCTNI